MRLSRIARRLTLVSIPIHVVGAQVILTGTVTDSLSGRPLAGAVVQIARDPSSRILTATSDSLGTYRIEGIAPGSYLAGFYHARLDSLGFELSPVRVEIGQVPVRRLDFAIPSAKVILASLCPAQVRDDSLGMLLGHVRDADSKLPRTGTVTVVWMEILIGSSGVRRDRQQIPAKTNDDGWFAFCGLPSDVDLTAIAQSGDAESGIIELRVPVRGLLLRDFYVSRPDSTIVVLADTPASDTTRRRLAALRRGSARVSGVVRNGKGSAVANAEVAVPGTGLSVRTSDSGVFAIGDLPAGTQTVEARALGFEPKRVTVDLTREHLTTVDIVLDRPVQTLDVVKIFGKGRASFVEFERRRRAGWGRFLTPVEIERRHAMRVSDLFLMMPGTRVVAGRGFSNVVLIRGCLPTVYLNGMRLGDDAAQDLDALVSPNELTAVEVYTSSGRPMEFWGNSCGSVVLWAGMLPR